MKCKTCGAPAKHMPPDGDFRYDPPRSTLPREGQGEAVSYQYRYKHNNPGAIWSSWGPPDPALESDTDFESERRPLYTAPSPAVRDGVVDWQDISTAPREHQEKILGAWTVGEGVWVIQPIYWSKWDNEWHASWDGSVQQVSHWTAMPAPPRALSTQEQGNG